MDGSMRVGLLSARFPPDVVAGAELQAQQLAEELARRGHDVTVFTRRGPGRPCQQRQDGYLIRRRNELPVPGLRVVWDTLAGLRQVAQQRPRPQVLLSYLTINGLVGVVAQAVLGIPTVVYIRGNKEYRLSHPGGAESAVKRVLVPGIYRRIGCLLVQSKSMLDDVHAQLTTAGKVALAEQLRAKTRVIPNGIRLSRGARATGRRVLYVGRLIEDKGVADLLRAMRQLTGAEVWVVGDGPDRGRLEALAGDQTVTFTGHLAHAEVLDGLQQARVLVLPTHLGDGLPNVILEAMAYGVPVVATHTAGIPDVVHHGETGFLIEPGDVDQMALYIGRLLSDDALWQALSQRSLEVVQSYSWDAVTPQIEAVLKEVISGSLAGKSATTSGSVPSEESSQAPARGVPK
jgi:glycosyltransferase involved in cell wall biosynthesis